MLKTTGNFSRSFDRMLWGWTNWWDLEWLVRWNFCSISKLALVIHAPGIDIPFRRDSQCELFSHLDVCDSYLTVVLLNRWLSSRDSSLVDVRWRLNTVSEDNLCWVLANRFLLDLVILRNVLIISTCAPLVNWSIIEDTSWMNKPTCNCLDSHPCEHLLFI